MTRAAIYVRISDDRAGGGLGVKRQAEDCREFAAVRGWDVVGVYDDNDKSAYSGRRRPSYERLLDDVARGTVDVVLAWHTDRLHRSPVELERYIEVCEKRSVPTETVKAGPLDLATPSGRMVARMLGSASRYESEHKSERARSKALQLAKDGKISGGGTRPFGYAEDRRTVVQSEAEVIRELARRVLDEGDSLNALANELNARGVLTSGGAAWKTFTLRRLLCSGRISGQREHQPRSRGETKRHIVGPIVGPAEWPAIITPEQTERLRALILDPARRTNVGARRYLLTGILRCHKCKQGLVGRPRDDKVQRYVCQKVPGGKGCGGTFILTSPTDAEVVGQVFEALDSPALADALRAETEAASDTHALTEVRRLEAKLDALRAEYAEDVLSRAEYVDLRGRVEAKLHASRRRLAVTDRSSRLRGLVGQREKIEAEWTGYSLDRKRAIITSVMEHVTVLPAVRGRNKFDPDRLTPKWIA
jgi:site-specific DNA recombinase